MDSDAWDMKYVIGVFKSLLSTLMLNIFFLLIYFIYTYIRFDYFTNFNIIFSNQLYFINNALLFLLIFAYFASKSKLDL